MKIKLSVFEDVTSSIVPDTILSTFMQQTCFSFGDLWQLRKSFTLQLAATTFLANIMSIGHRLPHKMLISRKTGNICMTDLLPRKS
jgi:transformation/transcription domain-associated protein